MRIISKYQCEVCDNIYYEEHEAMECEKKCNAPDSHMNYTRDKVWDNYRLKSRKTFCRDTGDDDKGSGDKCWMIYLGSADIEVKHKKSLIKDRIDIWIDSFCYEDEDDPEDSFETNNLFIIHETHDNEYGKLFYGAFDNKNFMKAVIQAMIDMELLTGKVSDYKLHREELGMQGNHTAVYASLMNNKTKTEWIDGYVKKFRTKMGKNNEQ